MAAVPRDGGKEAEEKDEGRREGEGEKERKGQSRFWWQKLMEMSRRTWDWDPEPVSRVAVSHKNSSTAASPLLKTPSRSVGERAQSSLTGDRVTPTQTGMNTNISQIGIVTTTSKGIGEQVTSPVAPRLSRILSLAHRLRELAVPISSITGEREGGGGAGERGGRRRGGGEEENEEEEEEERSEISHSNPTRWHEQSDRGLNLEHSLELKVQEVDLSFPFWLRDGRPTGREVFLHRWLWPQGGRPAGREVFLHQGLRPEDGQLAGREVFLPQWLWNQDGRTAGREVFLPQWLRPEDGRPAGPEVFLPQWLWPRDREQTTPSGQRPAGEGQLPDTVNFVAYSGLSLFDHRDTRAPGTEEGAVGDPLPGLTNQITEPGSRDLDVSRGEGAVGDPLPGLTNQITEPGSRDLDVSRGEGAVGDPLPGLTNQITEPGSRDLDVSSGEGAVGDPLPGLTNQIIEPVSRDLDVSRGEGTVSDHQPGLTNQITEPGSRDLDVSRGDGTVGDPQPGPTNQITELFSRDLDVSNINGQQRATFVTSVNGSRRNKSHGILLTNQRRSGTASEETSSTTDVLSPKRERSSAAHDILERENETNGKRENDNDTWVSEHGENGNNIWKTDKADNLWKGDNVEHQTTSGHGDDVICTPVVRWAGHRSMWTWCRLYCRGGHCPQSYCMCV